MFNYRLQLICLFFGLCITSASAQSFTFSDLSMGETEAQASDALAKHGRSPLACHTTGKTLLECTLEDVPSTGIRKIKLMFNHDALYSMTFQFDLTLWNKILTDVTTLNGPPTKPLHRLDDESDSLTTDWLSPARGRPSEMLSVLRTKGDGAFGWINFPLMMQH
jgi:hypothetical protein